MLCSDTPVTRSNHRSSAMDSQQRKLSDFHPWSSESSLTNQFILCLDNNAFSGEFMIHEMLIKLLRDKHNVYMISANHSRGHYEAILRKNVRRLSKIASGHDYLHHIYAVLFCCCSCAIISSPHQPEARHFCYVNVGIRFKAAGAGRQTFHPLLARGK